MSHNPTTPPRHPGRWLPAAAAFLAVAAASTPVSRAVE
jgi:hypothetical protein